MKEDMKSFMETFTEDTLRKYHFKKIEENGMESALKSFGVGYVEELKKVVFKAETIQYIFIDVDDFINSVKVLREHGVLGEEKI